MINLILPLPPSANRMWRKGKGRTYRSDEYDMFCTRVGWTCKEKNIDMISGGVQATIRFYFARVNGDLDNRIKPLLDALRGFAYSDDQQVMAFCCERHMDRKQPRVEIELHEIV